MVRTRFISGLIVGLPLLAIVAIGGGVYHIGLLVIMGVSLYEFATLLRHKDIPFYFVAAALWALGFCVTAIWSDFATWRDPLSFAIILIALASTLWAYSQGKKAAFFGLLATLGGTFYFGWGLAHFIQLRLLPEGMYWVYIVLLATVAVDVMAYFVGSYLGKHILVPSISPKKTWEGFFGGVVGGPLCGALFALLFQQLGAGPEVTVLHGAIIGLLVGALTPIGDLGISTLKRYVEVKDSSNLIPGHGGLLDRIDTQIIGCLVGYYYVTLIVM